MNRVRSAATSAALRAVNEMVLPTVKAGVASPPPGLGQGIVVLETRGRTSGRAREVPLAAVRIGDRIMVTTVRQNSQWLKNLEASPDATVWTCGRADRMIATVRRGPLNLVVLRPAS